MVSEYRYDWFDSFASVTPTFVLESSMIMDLDFFHVDVLRLMMMMIEIGGKNDSIGTTRWF